MFKKFKEVKRAACNGLVRINPYRLNVLSVNLGNFDRHDGFHAGDFIKTLNDGIDMVEEEFKATTGMEISRFFFATERDCIDTLIDYGEKTFLFALKDKIKDEVCMYPELVMTKIMGCFNNYGISTYKFQRVVEDGDMWIETLTVYSIPFIVLEHVNNELVPKWIINRIRSLQDTFCKFCPTVYINHLTQNTTILESEDINRDDHKSRVKIRNGLEITLFKQFEAECFFQANEYHTMMSTKTHRKTIRSFSFMPFQNISFVNIDLNYKEKSLYLCSVSKQLHEILDIDGDHYIYSLCSDIELIMTNYIDNYGGLLPVRLLYNDISTKSKLYGKNLFIVEYDWAIEHIADITNALTDWCKEHMDFEENIIEPTKSSAVSPFLDLVHTVDDHMKTTVDIILPSGTKLTLALCPPLSFKLGQTEWNKCLKEELLRQIENDYKVVFDDSWISKHIRENPNNISIARYLIWIDKVKVIRTDGKVLYLPVINRENNFDINAFKNALLSFDIKELPAKWFDVDGTALDWEVTCPDEERKVKKDDKEPLKIYRFNGHTFPSDAEVGIYYNTCRKEYYLFNGEEFMPLGMFNDIISKLNLGYVNKEEKHDIMNIMIIWMTDSNVYRSIIDALIDSYIESFVIRLNGDGKLLSYINNTKFDFDEEDQYDTVCRSIKIANAERPTGENKYYIKSYIASIKAKGNGKWVLTGEWK